MDGGHQREILIYEYTPPPMLLASSAKIQGGGETALIANINANPTFPTLELLIHELANTLCCILKCIRICDTCIRDERLR